jgi:hypothetical protein
MTSVPVSSGRAIFPPPCTLLYGIVIHEGEGGASGLCRDWPQGKPFIENDESEGV